MFKKNYLKFETDIDFNFIANLIGSQNLKSHFFSRWMEDYILESVFQIKDVQKTKEFNQIFKDLNSAHNKKNVKSDLDIFYSRNINNIKTTICNFTNRIINNYKYSQIK